MPNYRQFYIILVICIFNEGSKSDIMDNFDIQILSKLLNNCRESDRQIGIDLGMSGGAVNARIRKMQKLEIIESPFSRWRLLIWQCFCTCNESTCEVNYPEYHMWLGITDLNG